MLTRCSPWRHPSSNHIQFELHSYDIPKLKKSFILKISPFNPTYKSSCVTKGEGFSFFSVNEYQIAGNTLVSLYDAYFVIVYYFYGFRWLYMSSKGIWYSLFFFFFLIYKFLRCFRYKTATNFTSGRLKTPKSVR